MNLRNGTLPLVKGDAGLAAGWFPFGPSPWRRGNWRPAVIAAASIVALLVLTFSVSDSTLATLQLAAVAAALAVAFQVVYGLLGELSLGHSALFGAGAYAYATLALQHRGILLALIAAGVVAMLAGVLVAAVTGRLGGAYFAVATFAMTSIGAIGVSRFDQLGKDEGLVGIPAFPEILGLTHQQGEMVYTGLALVIAMGVLYAFRRSRAGLSLETVRADPSLARSLGINVSVARVVATGLSGLLAGLVGAVYAQQARFVSPEVFGFYYIITPLAIVAVGGLRWTPAALAGCIVVVIVPQLLGVSPIANQIFSAGMLLLVILLLPAGVIGGLARGWRRITVARREADLPISTTAAADRPASPTPDTRELSTPDIVLRAESVDVHFGALQAVSKMTLSVRASEILGLIGANGAGKSTFVNAVSGLVPVTSGTFWVRGREITRMPAHARARAGLARTFQQVLIAEDLTVRQSLSVSESNGHFWRRTGKRAAAEAVAARCGLVEHLDVKAGSLSFMHRRLLTIAMVLVRDPAVIMLDEVTAGLSDDERNAIGALVREIASQRGTAFIVIEHDVDFVARVSHRIAVMHEGRLLVQGPVEEVLVDPEVVASYLGTA
jgi:ABC-type branched-subunit amino acid transport system ATPase component/ABC-type branched-subunit amino acid transport system permease subunit